jgi:hypothetical protein
MRRPSKKEQPDVTNKVTIRVIFDFLLSHRISISYPPLLGSWVSPGLLLVVLVPYNN